MVPPGESWAYAAPSGPSALIAAIAAIDTAIAAARLAARGRTRARIVTARLETRARIVTAQLQTRALPPAGSFRALRESLRPRSRATAAWARSPHPRRSRWCARRPDTSHG